MKSNLSINEPRTAGHDIIKYRKWWNGRWMIYQCCHVHKLTDHASSDIVIWTVNNNHNYDQTNNVIFISVPISSLGYQHQPSGFYTFDRCINPLTSWQHKTSPFTSQALNTGKQNDTRIQMCNMMAIPRIKTNQLFFFFLFLWR